MNSQMTDLALAGKCGPLRARAGRPLGGCEAFLGEQRPEGEQAEAVAGASRGTVAGWVKLRAAAMRLGSS